MTQQFTASEVVTKLRERFASGNDVPVPDVRLTRAEFDVIADLLEAREKAVPVYQHRSKNGPMLRWFDCSEETFMAMEYNEHDKKHFDRRILYTHPAPADAERLAEALRAKIRQLRNMPKGEFQLAASIFADDLERIIAAHSAQAQPPAGEVHSCSFYCDRPECVKRQRDELVRRYVEGTGLAQPPDANVADAKTTTNTPDTARIDWLEAHPRLSTIVVDGKGVDCYFYGVAGAPGLKLREVIDAALAQLR